VVKVKTSKSSIAKRKLKKCLVCLTIPDQAVKKHTGNTKSVNKRKIIEIPSAPRVRPRLYWGKMSKRNRN
jgi:hypothetical protein